MGTRDLISPAALERFPELEERWSAVMDRVVRSHQRELELGTASVRKDAPESAVTLVHDEALGQICVKEIRWRGLIHGIKGLFKPGRGLRSFNNSNRLIESGAGLAITWALRREFSYGLVNREFIIMERPPGYVELDRLIAERIASGWDLRSKRAFIARFAQFMARLHSKGIFHSDLKTCNILMNEDPDGADFLLLDYDDVSFFSKLPISKRLKNLTQIFLSSPKAFNVKDRMLWLRIYTENSGLENQRLKVMGRRVINAASGRKILYVTHQGDQEEDWEE